MSVHGTSAPGLKFLVKDQVNQMISRLEAHMDSRQEVLELVLLEVGDQYMRQVRAELQKLKESK